MQLRTARLCLDCEELHEELQCPACASEAFAYVTRWIPVADVRKRKRSVPRPAPQPRVSHFVKGGAVGFAVLAAARWLLRNNPPASTPANPSDAAGEPADRHLPDDSPE
jgi:hypothetical protein